MFSEKNGSLSLKSFFHLERRIWEIQLQNSQGCQGARTKTHGSGREKRQVSYAQKHTYRTCLAEQSIDLTDVSIQFIWQEQSIEVKNKRLTDSFVQRIYFFPQAVLFIFYDLSFSFISLIDGCFFNLVSTVKWINHRPKKNETTQEKKGFEKKKKVSH